MKRTLIFLILNSVAMAQQGIALNLGSGSGSPGSTVSLPLSIMNGGNATSGVEWTLTYSTADFSSVTISAGAVVTSSGKTLSCNSATPGKSECIIWSTDTKVLSDGGIAIVAATLTNSPSNNPVLSLSSASAASNSAQALMVTATGTSVSIGVGMSNFSCSPGTITGSGSSSCTVTLNGPAPSGGATVSLGYASSAGISVSAAPSIVIPAGSNAGVFTVGVTSSGGSGNVQITASINGSSAAFSLSVAAGGSGVVVFDNAISSNYLWGVTSVTTPQLMIGSGNNRVAMIMVAMSANNATGIQASLGGVNGTPIPGTDSGITTSIRTLIYCVINPPSGMQSAIVSWKGTMNADIGVITVTGANQTIGCNNGIFAATNSAPAQTTALTITSNPGDLTSSVADNANQWMSPYTNQMLIWGIDQNATGGDIGPGNGTTTHIWNGQYVTETRSVSGANFKAAGP